MNVIKVPCQPSRFTRIPFLTLCILQSHLVSQYVVAEDLLWHGGEERDGVGHRQAHLLFCISHLKQKQQSPLNSTRLDLGGQVSPLSKGVSRMGRRTRGGGMERIWGCLAKLY